MSLIMQIGFKQFRDQCCLSYLLHDREAPRADGMPGILIDPCVALLSDYRHYLAENRIRLEFIIDTHTHSDHHSATHILARETGATIAMGAATRSKRTGRALNHLDAIQTGGITLQVLKTPGHSPDCISLFGHGMLFSGDSLLIGPSLPPELADADPAEQWNSFQEVFAKLPAGTIVLPAHDANDMLFSVLEVERKKNALWGTKFVNSKEDLIALRAAVKIRNPSDDIQAILGFNLEAGPSELPVRAPGRSRPYGEPDPELERFPSMQVSKFIKKVQKPEAGALFIDVRDPGEFRHGHIPKSINIPVCELGFRLADLRKASKIYICGNADSRGLMAARTLNYIGLPNVVLVEGGLRGWTNSGQDLEEG